MIRIGLRWLYAALAMMFAGTVALVLLLGRAAAVLHARDNRIAMDLAPRIVGLQSIGADVRKLDVLLAERALGTPGDPVALDEQIAMLRRDLSANERTSAPPRNEAGQAPLPGTLGTSLERFDALVERALARRPGAGATRRGLYHDLEATVAEAEANVAREIDGEAAAAKAAAIQASDITHSLLPAAVVLESLAVAGAAAAIVVTMRFIHRASATAEGAQLALARKADELEAFAGRIAHDLLSPLMTVGLALDLTLRREGREGDTTTAGLARASRTLQRVRGFVSDLLEFARAGARPPPGVHAQVGTVVQEVADQFAPVARESGVELRFEPSPDREVRCSPGVLTSLLSNLVQNAIKYVAGSATRRVVIRPIDLGTEVRVEVEDTGPGVAPPDRERLFEPYARGTAAKVPGIGLGLATVRRLAESHDGHVGVRTELGKGSVFWFSLPAAV